MSDSHDEQIEPVAATTEEHRRFLPFEGTFDAEVEMWMGPGDPMVMTGKMVNELDLGGRFLRQTYRSDGPEGPFGSFEGRGYWGYNNVAGRWEAFWIDNASTMMQTEAGTLDASGKVWTMVGEMTNPQTGGTMKKRSVITLVDDDHHTMETFFDTGEGELKAMAIRYRRST